MKLIEENFKSFTHNGAVFECDGKLVCIAPYVSDERWAEIKADLEPRLNEKLPVLIAKYVIKK